MMRFFTLPAIILFTLLGMSAGAQTPAAPVPPPTIRNSTTVPAAPVKADGDKGSAGELPLNTAGDQPATDSTPADSPVPAAAHAGYFAPGTRLRVRLIQTIDSGKQKNGDSVRGVLVAPVRTAQGKTVAAGTAVSATIVSSARAGTMANYGVLSLEVYTVGGIGVFTNVLDFNGQEGPKDVADSAPGKGTEAAVEQGTVLFFNVLGAGDNADPMVRGKRSGASAGKAPQ